MSRSWVISVFVALAIGCSTPKQPADDTDGGPVAGMDAGGCVVDGDCPGASFCSDGLCLPENPAGTPCSGNDQCVSGICGVVGAGHCCAVSCVQDSSHSCSPDDCNEVGVCSYPCSANCAKDADCRDPRICDHGACVYPDAGVGEDGGPDSGPVDSGPQCLIGGQFVPAGTWNPANSCQQCDPATDQLAWTSTFSPAATYSIPTGAVLLGIWPYSSTIGGLQDTLLVGEQLVNGTNQVVLLNGDLTTRSTLPVASRPSMLVTMDLNGDGLTDLVLGGYSLSGQGVYSSLLSLYLNDADGGFTGGAQYADTNNTEGLNDLQTGDFNGNGTQMLSVGVQVYGMNCSGSTQNTRIDLYPLAGDGGLAAPTTIAQQLPRGTQLVGDFNGDAKTDILFAAPGYDPPPSLTLFLSNGGGQFTASSEGYLPDSGTYGEVSADFNADGRADLAFPIYDTVDVNITLNVELADPQGHLGQPIPAAPPSPYLLSPLLAADFDGDGNIDLSAATYGCQQAPCDIDLWLGVGNGTFLPPIEIPSSLPPGWNSFLEVALEPSAGRKDLALASSYQARFQPVASYRITVFRNGCQ